MERDTSGNFIHINFRRDVLGSDDASSKETSETILTQVLMYMTFTAKYQESAHSREGKSHNKQSAEFRN